MTRRMRGTVAWAAVAMAALLTLPLLAEDKKPKANVPSTPQETLESFKVAPGLKATVWATEPGLVKPTNMDIDSKGRIWVTEAANYRGSKNPARRRPHHDSGRHQAHRRVRQLQGVRSGPSPRLARWASACWGTR